MYESLENLRDDKPPTYSVPCDDHLHEELTIYAPRLKKVTVSVINMHDPKDGSVATAFQCRCGKQATWMISDVK